MTVTPNGTHLLADLYGCQHLADPAAIEAALRAAVAAACATLVDIRLHHFGPAQGVTGVALLAESHISIHSWPEHGYAAIDIFLCGAAHDIKAALSALVTALEAESVTSHTFTRGMASTAGHM